IWYFSSLKRTTKTSALLFAQWPLTADCWKFSL
ncbi:Os08g0499250, partial [Oryza sativa Japonica Group]